jgi:hypothetical protein
VLADHLLGAALGALGRRSIHLGGELGLSRALARHGSHTADDPARAVAIGPRYAREWLELLTPR